MSFRDDPGMAARARETVERAKRHLGREHAPGHGLDIGM